MRDAEFNCYMCKKKYGRLKDRQRKHQEKKGCFETYPKPILSYLPKYSMSGYSKIQYFHCPARYYNPSISTLINYSSKYENGIMPYEGGYMDQPAKFVEIMELIYNLINEYTEEQRRTLEKYGRRSKN